MAMLSRIKRRFARLEEDLSRVKLEDISGSLHFDPHMKTWESFKKTFEPKVAVPDYLGENDRWLYETGKVTIAGIVFGLFGAHFPNPKWVEKPKEEQEKVGLERHLGRPEIAILLLEAIHKKILKYDQAELIAFFDSRDLRWTWIDERLPKLFGESNP